MKIQFKFFLVLFMFVFGYGFSISSHAITTTEDGFIAGWYEVMDLPTPQEKQEIEKFALYHGVDVKPVFSKMIDDKKAWQEVFKLSRQFKKFDRKAAVYGYQLFVASIYYIDSSSQEKFAQFFEGLPQDVKQSARDFLYFQAYNSDPFLRKANERTLMKYWNLIFPNDYVFGNGNKTFNLFVTTEK